MHDCVLCEADIMGLSDCEVLVVGAVVVGLPTDWFVYLRVGGECVRGPDRRRRRRRRLEEVFQHEHLLSKAQLVIVCAQTLHA